MTVTLLAIDFASRPAPITWQANTDAQLALMVDDGGHGFGLASK
jgi:hypothetical protein